jgi:DNA-binding HxlR family transcriptional regulator
METHHMTQQKKTTRCPAGVLTVGGRWKLSIGYHLLSGTRRFGELQRLIPQASRQMLTMQLRELEQMGMIHRQVSTQGPLKVEYSLTELGYSLEPVLRQIRGWYERNSEQMGLEDLQLMTSTEAPGEKQSGRRPLAPQRE